MRQRSDWPATRHVARPWRTNPGARAPGGARPNQADRMLTEITVEVPPRIADQAVSLPATVVAECEEARGDIAALEEAGGLAGLGDLLARTESVASSRIEQVDADLDELARASLGEKATESARRTMAAVQALRTLTRSCDDGRPLETAAILAAHEELLRGDPLEGRNAGRWRVQQNWLGGSDLTPRDAIHVPPPHEQVEELMEDLTAFANRDDVPGLAQAAIVHAQFEAIHPFTDGNGRIGRGVLGAVLRRRGVTRRTVVPIAAAMLADVDTYFDRLIGYRDGDAAGMVEYVAHAARFAAQESRLTATRLAELPDQWHHVVAARRGSAARALVVHLTEGPVVGIDRAQEVTGASRTRTYEAINRLTEAGVLDEITGGGRNRIWVAPDVMGELGDLEGRIGRRVAPPPRWR